MKYPTIEINHESFAVNLMDAEFAARLVEANTSLQAARSAAEEEHAGNETEILEAKVAATCTFFDTIFGPGTSDRVFKYYNEAVEYTDHPRLSSRKIGAVADE